MHFSCVHDIKKFVEIGAENILKESRLLSAARDKSTDSLYLYLETTKGVGEVGRRGLKDFGESAQHHDSFVDTPW